MIWYWAAREKITFVISSSLSFKHIASRCSSSHSSTYIRVPIKRLITNFYQTRSCFVERTTRHETIPTIRNKHATFQHTCDPSSNRIRCTIREPWFVVVRFSRERETQKNDREKEREGVRRERKRRGREKDGRTRFEIFNVHVHASAASYGIIIANHDRYLPLRIEFDRRKSARGATWFDPVHLLLFPLPRGCSIFRPVRRGNRKKKTGGRKEEKKRAGQGKQGQKTSGLGFSPGLRCYIFMNNPLWIA